jgi:hypothetical protein
MKRLAPIALLLALCLLVPASARANGDPASDVLLTDQVFLPYEAPISKPAADDLRKTVSSANAKGYKIRVALIAFTGDLGTAVSLWRHPQDYAKFLASEIAFVTTDRLLVAMPSGWGVYNKAKPVTKEQAILAKIKPGTTPTPLAESAAAAVRALAAAGGVTVPKPSGSSGTHDRLILGAAVAAFLLILVFPARRLRRSSRLEGQGASASERVR